MHRMFFNYLRSCLVDNDYMKRDDSSLSMIFSFFFEESI